MDGDSKEVQENKGEVSSPDGVSGIKGGGKYLG